MKRLLAFLTLSVLLLCPILSACSSGAGQVVSEDAWRAMFQLTNVTVQMTTSNATGICRTATYRLDGDRFRSDVTEGGTTMAKIEVYDAAAHTITAYTGNGGGEWNREEPIAAWGAWSEYVIRPLYVNYADEYPFAAYVSAGKYYEFTTPEGFAVRVYTDGQRLTRVITFDLAGDTHEAIFSEHGTTTVNLPN